MIAAPERRSLTPFQRVMSRLCGAVRVGDQWMAYCPAHSDSTRSLSIRDDSNGNVLLHCHGGCDNEKVLSSIGLSMRDLFRDPAETTQQHLTVRTLAEAKGLSVHFLEECGVTQDQDGVLITYRNRDGSLSQRQRRRTAIKAGLGSSWTPGTGKPIAYGLWRLDEMVHWADYIVLVEGESDSWTLWHNRIPALGIPGATMTKTLNVADIAAFQRVYVFREPDAGGESFVTGVFRRLATRQSRQEVFLITPPEGVKDVNDLFRLDPDGFRDAWQPLMDSAVPVILDAFCEEERAGSSTRQDLTDLGNAKRLVEKHGREMRYCYPQSRWYVWNGKCFTPDTTGQVERWAKETVLEMMEQAVRTKDDRLRAEMVSFALRSQSDVRIRAMVRLAQSEPGIPVLPEDLDRAPWLLNTDSGILDLKTGTLEPHRPEALMTKIAPVEFDPMAACPIWLAFLDRVLDGQASLKDYVQKAVGYAMTGDTSEQVFFFLNGFGANGKSTFLLTIKELLGTYAHQAAFSTFLQQDSDRVRNDIAALVGKRFVLAVEADAGRRLSESITKQLTGGDVVTARFLYQEYFEFRPSFKIFLAANHRPSISGQDTAMWRRIRLIPFVVQIPEREQDRHLLEKLRAELPGILNWALQGCLRWQKEGLGLPPAVADATTNYREEMDALGPFMDERCVQSGNAQVTSKALYDAYQSWCAENSERPLAKNIFATRLQEKGFQSARCGHDRTRTWLGIGLRGAAEQAALPADSKTTSPV